MKIAEQMRTVHNIRSGIVCPSGNDPHLIRKARPRRIPTTRSWNIRSLCKIRGCFIVPILYIIIDHGHTCNYYSRVNKIAIHSDHYSPHLSTVLSGENKCRSISIQPPLHTSAGRQEASLPRCSGYEPEQMYTNVNGQWLAVCSGFMQGKRRRGATSHPAGVLSGTKYCNEVWASEHSRWYLRREIVLLLCISTSQRCHIYPWCSNRRYRRLWSWRYGSADKISG